MILTIFFTLFFSLLKAPDNPSMIIPVPEAIRPYEAIWQAVCTVESGGDIYAIGDKRLKHHSYGVAQIRESRLDDYYRKTGIRYSVTNMFDPAKAKEVFMYYCNGFDMEVIARTWNGGERGMQKKSTIKYWKLIQKAL